MRSTWSDLLVNAALVDAVRVSVCSEDVPRQLRAGEESPVRRAARSFTIQDHNVRLVVRRLLTDTAHWNNMMI